MPNPRSSRSSHGLRAIAGFAILSSFSQFQYCFTSSRLIPRGLDAPTALHAAPQTDVAEQIKIEVIDEEANARKTGMALLLDDGTRKSHSIAENTQFLTGFFKGLGDKESFSKLVTSLYFVYKAMEEAFDTLDDPSVKALDYPELRRLPALEEDMEYFHGPEWRQKVQPSVGAIKYVEQIKKVAAEKPYLLVGHQYSRYVGDLFGGQMISGMAAKSLSLEQGAGTAFYDFKDISDTKAFIQTWYRALNDMELTDAQKEEIVVEANVVFRLNIEIFEELDGSALKAAWQLFKATMREKLGLA